MRGIRLISMAAGAALLIAVASTTGCQTSGPSGEHIHVRQVGSLENYPPMKVGVMEFPPYAFRSGGGQWSGLAVTLFQQIAASARLKYSYIEFGNQHEMLKAIEVGTIDCAAIALDPTPKLELEMNFTDAFDQSGTSVVIRKQKSVPLLEMVEQIWQSNIPLFTGVVLFILLSFGIIVGFVERRRNPSQFGGSILKTIGEGLWWSSSTMSTVGYGDRVPATSRGRAIGGLWMLLSFGLMTMLAGMFSSVLTVSRINALIRSASDLKSVACGAVEDSAALQDGKDLELSMNPYLTTNEALTALMKGEVGAVLGDTVRLGWILEQPEWNELAMLPSPLTTLYSAFPLRENIERETLDVINYHLLKITDSREWEQMRHLFLGAQHE